MRIYPALTAIIAVFCVQSAAVGKKPAGCGPDLQSDDSVQKGLLSHGEHWVDLILAQSAREEKTHLIAFEAFAGQLISATQAGEFKTVNEKIDGSPSVVFGWNAEGKPFVAYKSHFSSVTKQKLVTDPESALSVFPRSQALKHIFSTLFAAIEPSMRGQRGLKNYIFQGDLLFVKDDDRRTMQSDGIHIRANTVDYHIKESDPLFASLKRAVTGVAIHTVGKRTIGEDGRLGVEAPDEDARGLIEKFIERTGNEDVFLMHPLRDDVALAGKLTPAEAGRARALLSQIRSGVESLKPEFNQIARTHWTAELRVYFNSQVRPPNDGGIFRMIAEGQDVDARAVAAGFGNWLKLRKKPAPSEIFESSPLAIHKQLITAVEAYLNAVRLQYLLQPHLASAMRSKLGGGPVEGLILTDGPYIVKLVDRLDFTIQNNQKREAPGGNPFAGMPAPFDKWRGGEAFVLMKGQPVHQGHVEMIKLASEQFAKLSVVASEKAPNLEADKTTALGAAANLTEYRARQYKHVFSNELRGRIFGAALPDVDVHQVSTVLLWKYLETAQRYGLEGKIKLVVGQKEIDEDRYNEQIGRFGSHLELAPIALQAGGISATEIRALVKEAADGSRPAVAKLNSAYAFIENELERKNIILEMVREWKAVDEKAQSLLAQKKPKAG